MQKYTLDKSMFKSLDEESSYWLGFLAADGFVSDQPRNAQVRLKLNKKDIHVLHSFIKFAGTDKPLYWDGDYPSVILCSKEVVTDIKKYLPPKNKSKTLYLPQLPKSLIGHFLRGYFDGDGWASFIAPRTLSIGISGLGPIILSTASFLNVSGVKCSARKDPRSNAHTVYFSSRKAIENFYLLLHGDSNLRLDRKWENIERYLSLNIRTKN